MLTTMDVMVRSVSPLVFALLAVLGGCSTPEPTPPPEQPIRAAPSTPVERQAVPSVDVPDSDQAKPGG